MVETVKSTPRSETGRSARRREQRRQLIIAAAQDQIGEAGLAATTLASVGERVGLSKGALYYYVDSRDSLFALVLDDLLGTIRTDAAERAGDDPAPLDELVAFARAHVHAAIEQPAGPLIISNVDELAAHPPSAAVLHDHEVAAREIIARAVDAGVLRDVHPVVASTVFFGALNTLCRTYDEGGELSLDDMIDAALDLLLAGWRT